MRRQLLPQCLPLALLLLASTAGAAEIGCDIESDFDFTLNDQSVIFTRQSGVPKWVVIRGDRLFVDDRWVVLGVEDRKRVAAIDKGARAIVPLAGAIGRDAADIAFTALGEVAAGLSAHPDKSRAKLDQARKRIDARLAASIGANRFNSDALGEGIEEAVTEAMPALIGDLVGGALSAALSGDTQRLEAMDSLDQQIEARIEPRAKALEARAEQLCTRMLALDQLDNALAYRLPSGGRLNLLDAKPHTSRDQKDQVR